MNIESFTLGRLYEIINISENNIIIKNDYDKGSNYTIKPDQNGLSWKSFFSLRETKLSQLLDGNT